MPALAMRCRRSRCTVGGSNGSPSVWLTSKVDSSRNPTTWIDGRPSGSRRTFRPAASHSAACSSVGRRLMGAQDLDPYPVVGSRLDGGGWMTDPDALRVLFTEYNKYLLALARGAVPVSPGNAGFGVANASAAAE